MPRIELSWGAAAPPERLFDLSRCVEAHVLSTAGTGERVVGGVAAGLLGPGDEVTWEARHLGVRQRLTSRITAYDRPRHFRDSQVRGAFAWFDHDHWFTPDGRGGTRVLEHFDYEAPCGPLGRLAEAVFLTRYMRRFLQERSRVLRQIAETDEWRRFLGPPRGA